MKTKKQLQKKKFEIEKKIKKLKLLEESKDYVEIGKFRIYIWENKPFKDLKVKGYEIAEFQDFIELVNSGNFELETWKYYYVKHFLKTQWDKKYCLSGVFLYGGGGLGARGGDLANSYFGGRVVVSKNLKELK